MKQPAKFSLAGLVLAVIAAIFYPKLLPESGGASAAADPAATAPADPGAESAPTSAAHERATETALPAGNPGGVATDGASEAAQALARGTGGARAPSANTKPTSPAPSTSPNKTPNKTPPTTSGNPPPATSPPKVSTPAPAKPAPAKPTPSKVGFTSRQSWLDHFDKHGHEFGKITADEYLTKAQALRDAALTTTILENVRESDGVITRFDKKSGGFVAFHKDKSIRTFFRPNDGEAYFKRQLQR